MCIIDFDAVLPKLLELSKIASDFPATQLEKLHHYLSETDPSKYGAFDITLKSDQSLVLHAFDDAEIKPIDDNLMNLLPTDKRHVEIRRYDRAKLMRK